MSSASESSSLPMGEETPNSLALIPSKKSNTAPMTIHSRASSGLFTKANDVAMQPEMRLQQVIELGMFRAMKFAIIFIS